MKEAQHDSLIGKKKRRQRYFGFLSQISDKKKAKSNNNATTRFTNLFDMNLHIIIKQAMFI